MKRRDAVFSEFYLMTLCRHFVIANSSLFLVGRVAWL